MRYFLILCFLSFSFSTFAATTQAEQSNCYCVDWAKEEFFKTSGIKPFYKMNLNPYRAKVIRNVTTCPAPVAIRTASTNVTGGKRVVTVKQTCKIRKAKV